MARARNIKPGFFTNDELVELPFEVRLLFIGLWTLADKEGRLVDRPKKIKMEIFPADDVDCEVAIGLLEGRGFLRRYEVEGQKIIEIVNWNKHQNPHIKEAASALPCYPVQAPEIPVLTPDSPEQAPEIPEGAGLIPDSGLLVSDSLIPDTGSLIPEEPPLSLSSPAAPKNDRDEIAEIFGYWQKRMDSPTSKLDDKRRKAIKKALAMKYSPADLCRAIRGCSLTPHNMGENDRHEKFNGIDLIFRNADQIDRFIANSSSPPRPSAAGSPAQRREAESEANLRAFLGETQPQDPMTIEME